MLKRIAFSMAALGILSACQPTPTVSYQSPADFEKLDPKGVRIGLTAAQTANLIAPRKGQRVRFRMPTRPSFPFPSVLDVRMQPSDYGFEAKGYMRVELPIEDIGDIIEGLKEATGRTPNLDGRDALIPVHMGFDKGMRSIFSEIMGRDMRDVPHDCFMVIGKCTSSKYVSDIGWSYREYTTFEEAGRFYAIKRMDPKKSRGRNDILEVTVYSVDKSGLPLDIHAIDYEDEEPVMERFKRLN